MKVFYLSAELGEEHPYVVGLQAELASVAAFNAFIQNLALLDARMVGHPLIHISFMT